jgi:two-component system sensor histidine kinase YesM
VGVLFFSNQYAINVVKKQVAESYGKTTELYVAQIDNQLTNVDRYISITAEYDRNMSYMREAKSEEEYNKAKIGFYNQNFNTILVYDMVSVFYVYSKERNDFLELYNSNFTYDNKTAIKNYMEELLKTENATYGYNTNLWEVHKIEDEYYLLHVFVIDNMYFIACIKMNELIDGIKSVDIGNQGYAFFTNSQNETITDIVGLNSSAEELDYESSALMRNRVEKSYQSVVAKSKNGDYQFEVIIPNTRILENLPELQRITILLFFVSIFVILVGLYMIRKTVNIPLKNLVNTMKKAKNGDLEVRMETKRTSDEFMIVNQTFNTMVSQIQNLKIEVYEEQMKRQKEELYRLQLQLNPHFFMNTLNILYNISKTEDNALMQEMTLNLADYFKYIFRNSNDFVQLKEEIEHVKVYLNIQKIRLSQNLSYNIDCEYFLADKPVPILIIQTFVGNSIKHTYSSFEDLVISVKADFMEIDDERFIKIKISDNGKGFEENVLRRIQDIDNLETEDVEHIGIWNIKRRLNILYAGKASINFYNEGGAVVEIMLPMNIWK